MKAPDNFDANMTYWQSLRIVAKGLIQWPLHRHEVRQIGEAIKEAATYTAIPLMRLIALILLPISAPIFTLLVQMDRKKIAAAREAAKKRRWPEPAPAQKDAA